MAKLAAIVLVLSVPLTAGVVWWYSEIYRPRVAFDMIGIALRTSAPDLPLELLHEAELLPKEITDREEAVIYLLLSADEIDRRSGASFWLGVVHVDDDCELARRYFTSHLEVVGSYRKTELALEAIETGGCQTAYTAIFPEAP